MKKCVVTGKETNDYLSSVPVSKEGRNLLNLIVESHNNKIFEVFKEKNREANNGIDLDDDTLRRFSPSLNKRKVLDLLIIEERDIMKTKEEVLGA